MTFGSHKPKLEQVDPPRSPRETLPTMYDLPSEFPEEPGLLDTFHDLQPQLLSRTLRLSGYGRDRYFTASDLNVYYDVHHPLWHKRPDWFLAVNVPPLYDGQDLRRSYVVWQEGENPFIIVELLSPGTQAEDLGRFARAEDLASEAAAAGNASNGSISAVETTRADRPHPPGKLEVYEQYLRVPHYSVYSRYTEQLRYFKLEGDAYQEQPLNPSNPLAWIESLDIGLGIWDGEFEGVQGRWLRWCDRAGNWLLTDTEQAQAQLLQAARNLLNTGMPESQVIELLELSAEQLQQLNLASDTDGETAS